MKRFVMSTALLACAAAQAAPETYVIDGSRTASEFSYRYLGGATQTNRFERVSGTVVFDRAEGSGRAEVTIDATSVNTGQPLLDAQMQAADFFDTANYPVITFRSTKMTLNGDRSSLAGDLTIKGVTRPVTLAVSRFQCMQDPAVQAEACGAQATVTIRRSDFNMGKYPLLVSNDITLHLAFKAVRAHSYLQVASRDPMR
ncbi:YceI family protein [Thiobacillus sedimenti]|uniref:YceI family protein n=1 Tax=Thiobacillus sedimenti TaxID=3110231 RepID=A0ABZ1CG29_9PROT|nr:YceI family protein [Thiobacillus sp. SCUT-2]WRS37988.1 YceI family protein [Thiobacillus sp. SCUT-2]